VWKNRRNKRGEERWEEREVMVVNLFQGTPVQNNLQELHCLLHFLMPKLFRSTPATFESWFVQKKGGKKQKQGDGELEHEAAEVLHEILRPFFLRRTKEEVLKDLPPKSEIILYSGMHLRRGEKEGKKKRLKCSRDLPLKHGIIFRYWYHEVRGEEGENIKTRSRIMFLFFT
jgi:hypothetical protein